MTDKTANDWIENTGTVPAGVGPDTQIEVEYRDGKKGIWGVNDTITTDNPYIWRFGRGISDVIRFRFLEAAASAAAQAGNEG
jgi:hypothetical protein